MSADTFATLQAKPITAEAIAPFGALIESPKEVGVRNFYTDWLGSGHEAATPRLHINHVAATSLPHSVGLLEHHPHTAQIFLPLNVDSYFVIVAPSLEDGSPDLAAMKAFVAPGNVGIVYKKNVWHAGATSLARNGNFAVIMWRHDKGDDDVFLTLAAPLHITL